MFAMTMTMRLPGLLDGLIHELESTPSASRRARLIRKLALSHLTQVIDTIIPFLAGEPRVRRAAIESIVSFGEDARAPMLDLLREPWQSELHPGAIMVLAGIVRACASRARRGQDRSASLPAPEWQVP